MCHDLSTNPNPALPSRGAHWNATWPIKIISGDIPDIPESASAEFHHILSSKTHWNVKSSRLWNTNLPNHQHFRICGLSKFFEDPSDVRPGCRGFAAARLVSPLRRMCTPKLPRPDTCARLLLLGWWRGISDVPDNDDDDDEQDEEDNYYTDE